ncbi:nucleotidyltransferase domain-containing protein [Micromonospora sp. RP3T]|uniref:nucleotidyltransferase domain-containing protein n=1 Tax=Micromonospora sp. RP3T TaxID=2135446 RepID=UPI003D750DB8
MTEDHRPDIELLLLAARPRLTVTEVDQIGELIVRHAADLDWGWLIEQAHLNKVLPLVAQNFLDHHLYPTLPDSRLRFRYEQLFRLVADGNSARNDTLLRELAVILRTFEREGISALVRKGAVVIEEAYGGDRRFRSMNDLDLMFEPEDVARAIAVLETLGYARGKATALRRTIAPLSRSEAVYARLKVPTVTLLRPSTDRFVDYLVVDICLNQFLPDSGYDLPAGGFAHRARPISLCGEPALMFTAEEMVIDLAVHLFKEATTLRFIESGKDLCLSKFLDIAQFVKSSPELSWPTLYERCARYRIAEPVYFALHFTDLLYPGVIPAEVLVPLRPENLEYLNQFGAADKHHGTWSHESFLDRMFDRDRATKAPPSRALV